MDMTDPIHQPCPDLPAFSLNREQKERGLALLRKAKAQVGERIATQLREEIDHTESKAKASAMNQRLRHIERHWC